MAKLIRLDKGNGRYALARKGGKLVTDAGGAPCCCGCGGSCSDAPVCATTNEPSICWNSELDWGRQQTLRIQLTQAGFTRNRGGRNLFCNMTSPGSVDLKIGWKDGLWGVCDVQNETPPEWSIYYEEFLGGGQWNFGGFGTHTSKHFGADMALSMGFNPFGPGQAGPLDEYPDVVCPFWPNQFVNNDQWPFEAQRFMLSQLYFTPSASMAFKAGENLAVTMLTRPTQRVRTLVQVFPVAVYENIFHCQRTFENDIHSWSGPTSGTDSLNNWVAAGVAYRDLATGDIGGQQGGGWNWGEAAGERMISTLPIHDTSQQADLGDGSTTVSRSTSSTGGSVNYTSTHATTNQSGATVLDSTGGFSYSISLIDSTPCDQPANSQLPPHLDEYGRPKKQPGQCAGCGD